VSSVGHNDVTLARKRSDSLQPSGTSPPSSWEYKGSERSHRTSTSVGGFHGSFSPSQSHSQGHQGGIRRLSGNFNAPTHVELERYKDNNKGSRGISGLKNAVKRLVRE